MKTFRPGAVGALLDEYERAIADLIREISTISDQELIVITDPQTMDENCRSVQAILSHVVHSGYGYAVSIFNQKGQPKITRSDKVFHSSADAYVTDLQELFVFTEKVFGTIKDEELEEFDEAKKIKGGWLQTYDIEQMTEHAIVHILRHRRQIEKIKQQWK